jgi:hypothetical protein
LKSGKSVSSADPPWLLTERLPRLALLEPRVSVKALASALLRFQEVAKIETLRNVRLVTTVAS